MKTIKNNQISKLLAVMLASLAFSISTFAGTPIGDFRMLKNRNGIDLYYRWMQMEENNKVRQMKAVVEINGGTEDVLRLLKDEEQALGWIPSAEQFRHLAVVSDNEWVSYIQFAVPWPFADQDCILEYRTCVNPAGETVIDFRCNPEYIGTVDGISRMKDITGSFVIREQAGGHSILECFFLSEKASVIPRWITEPIITGSILGLMEAMRDELTEV
jgi:hypothetical protein